MCLSTLNVWKVVTREDPNSRRKNLQHHYGRRSERVKEKELQGTEDFKFPLTYSERMFLQSRKKH